MCGRFYIQSMDVDELRKIIQEIESNSSESDDNVKIKLGEIFPTDVVPVIAYDKNNQPTPSLMKWGFAKPDGKGVIINARSETVCEKAMFRSAVMNRRCLIPALHYFEWDRSGGKKVKYAIKTEDDALIFMAGIYRFEKNSNVPVFTILTTSPADTIRFIHDRMPVLIPRDLHKEWLMPGVEPQKVLQAVNARIIYEAVEDKPNRPIQTSFL